MTTDTIGRAVALVLGIVSAACALGILLEDVATGVAPFALKHALTIGIVALAILAGHAVHAAFRARSAFGVVGFTIVFLAATALVVFKSTGRQAQETFQSQAEADLAVERRAAIKAALARSEAMLADAQRDLARECKSGRGKRCQGIETTIGVYEAAITGHRANLDRLGPPKPVAPDAENFAALAAVFGADRAKVKAASILVVPFIQTGLYEFGAIVGLFFAFRHRPEHKASRTIQKPETELPRVPTDAERAQTDFYVDDIAATLAIICGKESGTDRGGNLGKPMNKPGNPSNPGGNGGGKRVLSKGEAKLDLIRRLASGEEIPSQQDLAHAWGVNPGTASKWIGEWREQGMPVAVQRVGRCHRLVAA